MKVYISNRLNIRYWLNLQADLWSCSSWHQLVQSVHHLHQSWDSRESLEGAAATHETRPDASWFIINSLQWFRLCEGLISCNTLGDICMTAPYCLLPDGCFFPPLFFLHTVALIDQSEHTQTGAAGRLKVGHVCGMALWFSMLTFVPSTIHACSFLATKTLNCASFFLSALIYWRSRSTGRPSCCNSGTQRSLEPFGQRPAFKNGNSGAGDSDMKDLLCKCTYMIWFTTRGDTFVGPKWVGLEAMLLSCLKMYKWWLQDAQPTLLVHP